jgi:pimeloyl-ACP methyl ester carboxylesterase
MKRKVTGVAVALLAMFLLLYFFQDAFIFQTKSLERNYTFSFRQPYEEHFISTPDGAELNVLWFKTEKIAKGIVLYFHGNAGNLQRWGNYASDFTHLGYDVVMMDYRGYGKSTGHPEEEKLYADSKHLWQWVKEKSAAKPIVFYGRSLGSAVAAYLASQAPPDLLILETPFHRLRGASMAKIFFALVPLRNPFPTEDFLRKVVCRKVIFHGTDDWVVPISSAERLKPLLTHSDQFIVIPQGGHHNLRDFPVYHTALASVLP